MKTFRFKDFQVYKDAKKLRRTVLKLLQKFPSEEKYRLVDQIHRSCLSIILNIAEGSAKKSDKDFARFLEMGIASTSELIAAFDVALEDRVIMQEDMSLIEAEAEIVAKQLGSFLKILHKPAIKQPKANSQ